MRQNTEFMYVASGYFYIKLVAPVIYSPSKSRLLWQDPLTLLSFQEFPF